MNDIRLFKEQKQTDYYKKITKKINGALKSAISAHGSISKNKINSATKRIVSQILVDNKPELSDNEYYEFFVSFYLDWVEKLRVNRKQLNHNKNEEQIMNLRAKNKMLSKVLKDFRKRAFRIQILKNNLTSIFGMEQFN